MKIISKFVKKLTHEDFELFDNVKDKYTLIAQWDSSEMLFAGNFKINFKLPIHLKKKIGILELRYAVNCGGYSKRILFEAFKDLKKPKKFKANISIGDIFQVLVKTKHAITKDDIEFTIKKTTEKVPNFIYQYGDRYNLYHVSKWALFKDDFIEIGKNVWEYIVPAGLKIKLDKIVGANFDIKDDTLYDGLAHLRLTIDEKEAKKDWLIMCYGYLKT